MLRTRTARRAAKGVRWVNRSVQQQPQRISLAAGLSGSDVLGIACAARSLTCFCVMRDISTE